MIVYETFYDGHERGIVAILRLDSSVDDVCPSQDGMRVGDGDLRVRRKLYVLAPSDGALFAVGGVEAFRKLGGPGPGDLVGLLLRGPRPPQVGEVLVWSTA